MDQTDRNDRAEFEQALKESLADEGPQRGELVKGTIVAVHGDAALVDVGGKSEAVLPREELDELGVGDPLEVVVTSVGEEVRVSRRLAIEQKLGRELRDAADNGSPVEGKVVGRRKGGYDVTIAGIRGFCPASQIDVVRTPDLDEYLGGSFEFKVLEFEPDSQNLVVSRAALIRETREKQREETMERVEEGAVLEGMVRSLTDFGAFVDLGGIDGLVHVTELSHGRIGHPSEVVEIGQTVRVKVTDVDVERKRIGLSIKQLQDDPWDTIGERHPVGSAFEGTVVRKAPFGAFVELEPGLDGLLHTSQLPPGMGLDAPELEVGETISGYVQDIDSGRQRIGLTLRPLPESDPWDRVEVRYQVGQTVDALVENGADFGVFVEVEPGLSALIPASEMGMGRNVDPREAMTPGQEVRAKILSIDGDKRRMSLSIDALNREKEREEYSKHMDRADDEEESSSVFADKLRQALEKKKS